MVEMLERGPVPALTDERLPEGYVTFYRRDDVSAAAYFHLDRASNDLPPLAPVEARMAGLSN